MTAHPIRRVTMVAVGLAVLLATIAIADVGIRGMVGGDGLFYRQLAESPRIPRHGGDIVYRAGRVVYPTLGWVLAAGRRGLVPWMLVAINVAAIGALVAACAVFLRRRRLRPELALLLVLLPAVGSSLRFSFLDVVATAFAVVGVVAYEGGRRPVAWAALALAALTRETMLLALLPVVLSELSARRLRDAVVWAACAVPLGAWWVVLRIASGEWPPFASSSARTGALDVPFGAFHLFGSLSVGSRAVMVVAVAGLVASVALALTARAPTAVVGAAVIFNALVPILGANVWPYWGDALRVLLPGHVFLLLAVAERASTDFAELPA
jgi:hypothetical protein